MTGCEVDVHGIVRAAGLHDAALTSFSYEVGVRAAFVLRGPSGTDVEVVFERPLVMNVASLWEGSIVDRVFLWRADGVPPEVWREPDNGWNALLDGRVSPSDRPAEARRLTARHPAASLAVVSCSYGGAWAALVEGFRLVRR